MAVDTQTDAEEPIEAPQRDLDALAQQEGASRPERIQRLSSQVDDLFQGEELEPLKDDIKQRSFNTPQHGEFHTEGVFMDTHLERILATIDDIENGLFHPMVPEDLRPQMQQVVRDNKRSLQMYAYLHDISKPDCLAVKYEDGRREEISWDDWQSRLPEGVNGNPVAMRAFYKQNGINGIGYVHQETQNGQHGKVGVSRLSQYGDSLPVPPVLLTAIERHEVAFQFQNISVKTYKKYFGELSDEERIWAITASYTDTMSSIRQNGEPDLSNFRFLVDSANNYQQIEKVEKVLKQVEGLDQNKVTQEIQSLINQKSRIEELPEAIAAKLSKECKISQYDKTKLESSLSALVLTGQIDETKKLFLLEAIDDESGQADKESMKAARKTLGKANQLVQAALSDSEIK